MKLPSGPFDEYERRARLTPALLVVLPLALATVAWFPTRFAGWAVFWAIVVGCGGTVLLAQLARDRGRQRQRKLFQSWGGSPTVLLLRHREASNKTTLMRWHRKLREMLPDVQVPSAEDELADPTQADEVYEAFGVLLREKTRDRTKFPLVFEENCNYGFRRNLWGMKSLGITGAIIGVVAIAVLLLLNTRVRQDSTPPVAYVAGALDALLLIVWTALVTPAWVKTAADAYAMRLLSSCDHL